MRAHQQTSMHRTVTVVRRNAIREYLSSRKEFSDDLADAET